MRAIDLIFRETLTEGQFEMKSHNGRFEAYQYNGMGYEHMQNLLEAIFLNKVNK